MKANTRVAYKTIARSLWACVLADELRVGKPSLTGASCLFAVALILFYLVSPIFTATHFEVLSAQVQINAIAANENQLALANVSYPIHTEYFYLTRIGVVYLLQFFAQIVGNGDMAFRVTVILSFALYISMSVVLAYRYAQVNRLASLFVLLMTPGVASIGFFFNDNVVSEGIGMLSLALVPPAYQTSGIPFKIRSVLSGVCLGFAFLARSDAFLFVPILGALNWLESKDWRRLIRISVLVCGGFVAVLLLTYVLSGVSIVQIFKIGRFFQMVHDNKPRGHVYMIVLGLLFVGIPNLILIPLGATLNLRGGSLTRCAILLGLPLVLFLLFAGHALETRMFFPILAPFIAMHAGRGLEWLFENLRSNASTHRIAARLMTAMVVLIALAPPIYVPIKEGPRELFGQFWAPLLWRQWQLHETSFLDEAQRPVDAAERFSGIVVVTLDYTSDAFLRLRLWQSGFRPTAPQSITSSCNSEFEVWRKGDRLLMMVRTENPHQFVSESHNYVEALEIVAALKCDTLSRSQRLFGFGSLPFDTDSEVQRYVRSGIPNLDPTQIWSGWPNSWSEALAAKIPPSAWMNMTTIIQRATPLSHEQLDGLMDAANRELVRQRTSPGMRLRELSELRSEWRYRFWHP